MMGAECCSTVSYNSHLNSRPHNLTDSSIVKAMYNYTATIEEEFDFQEGDIIAVTSTPEDGWWHGVLLDDTRRVPGRTVFPSNFVTLF
jgi:hypothetical protein